jgi:hypothetical protein
MRSLGANGLERRARRYCDCLGAGVVVALMVVALTEVMMMLIFIVMLVTIPVEAILNIF